MISSICFKKQDNLKSFVPSLYVSDACPEGIY